MSNESVLGIVAGLLAVSFFALLLSWGTFHSHPPARRAALTSLSAYGAAAVIGSALGGSVRPFGWFLPAAFVVYIYLWLSFSRSWVDDDSNLDTVNAADAAVGRSRAISVLALLIGALIGVPLVAALVALLVNRLGG